jgi:light-regulated signal transduction histidine kinase (bacteriophytochrome)/CheY-like chemotaxis protein
MNKQTSVDLSNCDREPIHIPGSIQPHGCLIACDILATSILRHSENCGHLLGVTGGLNGRLLDEVVGAEIAHAVRNALTRSSDPSRPALMFGLTLENGRSFDVAVHRFKATTIVEFESAGAKAVEPLELTRAMIGRITAIENIDRLTRDTARLIQALLGYDRVMVYQFAHDGSGKVVSESKRANLESFLGQYFPAGDIPVQARALYLRNTIRIISDASGFGIPIVPTLDSSGEPLDLSFAHLRSVSPIHCEYLRNMGVGSSMSISIIVNGELWGLIACHHYSPRTLSMAERVAAEMFGQFFSLHLHALKQKNKLEAATRARNALDRFLRMASRTSNIEELLRESLADFARLIPCDGIGLWVGGRWSSVGSTPPAPAIPALGLFAQTVAEGRVWATHVLSNFIPEAHDYSAQASGMLAIALSQRPRDYLLFFRKELIHTLDWAGTPEKSYESGPLGDRLTPRKSFAIWKETVDRQATPWTEEDQEIAEATRAALVEVVLHHSELLADERAKSDVRQRMLNEELNHRVKNILAIIKSLVAHPGAKGQTLENYIQSLRGRIQALAFAHDQVVRGDGGGALADLVLAELTPYQVPGSTIVTEGPNVWLDARAFSVLALVLHELSTNAAKYGALSKAGGSLTVSWSTDATGACTIEWRERGGPTVAPPRRRGFGTVLIDRSIPFDLGGESDVKFLPEGITATFHLPERHVSEHEAQVPVASPGTAPQPKPAATDLAGVKILVVEDQMLVALDLEQILSHHGVTEIMTAASAAEALKRLQTYQPDIAILDVNLGTETSASVADELTRLGVPFTFATGYGDRSVLPDRFASVPVVRKPYEAASIIEQVSQILRASSST